MIDLLASAIIIYGNSNGVWSPSHPHLFPKPSEVQQTTLPSLPQIEDRYIPDTPMTGGHGNLIFPHKVYHAIY